MKFLGKAKLNKVTSIKWVRMFSVFGFFVYPSQIYSLDKIYSVFTNHIKLANNGQISKCKVSTESS